MNVTHVPESERFKSRPDVDIVAGVVMNGDPEELEEFRAQLSAGMRAFYPQFSWKLAHATLNPASGKLSASSEVVVVPVERFGVHRVTFPAHGVPAKTNGFRAILSYARSVRAKVVLLLDPGQTGFDCTWVDALIRPCLHSKYDLVTPVYSVSPRERLLSTNLIAPMFQALFGVRLTQPMGAELAISGRLAERLLKRRDWDSPAARFAPELWMSFISCIERFRLAETVVGVAHRKPAQPILDFSSSLSQLVSALFSLMEQYEERWNAGSQPLEFDTFGQRSMPTARTEGPDGLDQVAAFVRAFDALSRHWQAILDPHTYADLIAYRESLLSADPDAEFGNALWVRVVYEFAAAWKHRVMPRAQVMGLFAPLYRARAGSFLLKTRWKEMGEMETEAARVGMYFEAIKPVLDRLWCEKASAGPLHAAQEVLRLGVICSKP